MNIVFAAGASGGHVFPAIETAQELKGQGHVVIFLTTNGLAEQIIKKSSFQFHLIDVHGIDFSSFMMFVKSIISMIKAISQSVRLLRMVLPDKVVGFGGYASFPVVFAAFLTRKPVAIHEQNVIPGKANRLSSIFAKKVMISFERTTKYFPKKKVLLTGCPCRYDARQEQKEKIYQQFKLDPYRPTILVMGGSQGSSKINQEFSKAVETLKDRFQFIHLCGQKAYEELEQKYAQISTPFHLVPFLTEIHLAYQVADLVIARAGAVTVCEILAYRKKALIVPYPFAGGHQKENAKILVEAGLARVIDDQSLSASGFIQEIQLLFEEKEKLNANEKINLFFKPNATKQLSQAIVQ